MFTYAEAKQIATHYTDPERADACRDGYYCGRNGINAPLKPYSGKVLEAFNRGKGKGASDARRSVSAAPARMDDTCITHGYKRPCPGCGR